MTRPERFNNRAAWDCMAAAKEKWFRTCTHEDIERARRGDPRIKLTPTRDVPLEWLSRLSEKSVLCLAGAGGQQAPLIAATGAKVTVFDISAVQLARDQDVADREKLTLRTVVGDMRDLSEFSDEDFDLIVNPTSVCYCPDVLPVWRECFRVLKPGGELIVGGMNPNNFLFDARLRDRGILQVRHAIPYSDLQLNEAERNEVVGADNPIHFGHTFTDLIGGQIAAGFEISGFYEDRWGDRDKLSDLIAVFFCTKATKRKVAEAAKAFDNS